MMTNSYTWKTLDQLQNMASQNTAYEQCSTIHDIEKEHGLSERDKIDLDVNTQGNCQI